MRQHIRALQPFSLPKPQFVPTRTVATGRLARQMACSLLTRSTLLHWHQSCVDGASSRVCDGLQELRYAAGWCNESEGVEVSGCVYAVFHWRACYGEDGGGERLKWTVVHNTTTTTRQCIR